MPASDFQQAVRRVDRQGLDRRLGAVLIAVALVSAGVGLLRRRRPDPA